MPAADTALTLKPTLCWRVAAGWLAGKRVAWMVRMDNA